MITQNNKNQSDIRKNLTNILGLTETEKKLTVKNSERILGSNGAFYFGGSDPQTGQGGGCKCNDHPQNPSEEQGGGGGESGSGGDSGGGGAGECDSEEISENSTACTVTGYDCETGQAVRVQLRGGGAIDDCGYGDECSQMETWSVMHYNGMTQCGGDNNDKEIDEVCIFAEEKNILLQSAKEKAQKLVNSCAGFEVSTRIESDGLIQWNFIKNRYGQVFICIIQKKSNTCSIVGCENRKKYFPKEEQYFIKQNQIYNACDPYGEPPQECIDMCDSNGNKYRVCGNGNITKLS